ncbi:heme peroxidase [Massarina eburnea CBS 473.64]|uniref:Peroxidase n=1 Tax=Massarina eburnea CBS 473.64 TaxID=1395130 RepID=A0A6A6SDM8_9PLEO|nr:heme peroxidase [Massarina eburnea CBS 473.64]
MHSSSIILAASFAAICQGYSTLRPIQKRQSSCPSVWTEVATDLQSSFVSDGTCTDAARQAIRLSFHDCFPGSCDGSIITANECTDRGENSQMTEICGTLGEKSTSFNVSNADLIQFAAAIGIASCDGGFTTSFYAGRTDTDTANPTGQMPGANINATALVSLFTSKGFTKTELVALSGAHTIGKQLNGSAMDTSVGKFDSGFYKSVSDGSANPINADKYMSNSSDTKTEWNSVGASQTSFQDAFVPAMEKMSLMGWDKADLTDCSDIISGFASGSLKQSSVVESGSSQGSTSSGDDATKTGSATRNGDVARGAILAFVSAVIISWI